MTAGETTRGADGAWAALAGAFRAVARPGSARGFWRRSGAGATPAPERRGTDARLFEESGHCAHDRAAVRAGARPRAVRSRARAARRRDGERHRGARGAAHGAARHRCRAAAGAGARGAGRAQAHGGAGAARARRRLGGMERRAGARRREHRHRRFAPRAGLRDRGPGSPARRPSALPFRVQRRSARPRGRAGRARAGAHAVHRGLQVLRHAGDAGERAARRGAGCRPAGCPDTALDRHFLAVSSNVPRAVELRHRRGQRAADVGLGRRALLAVVGDRAADRDGGGHGGLRRAARRRARDGPAFPRCAARVEHAHVAGADRRVAPQFPRRRLAGGDSLRPVAAAAAGVPAAAGDGEQRQVRRARRHAAAARELRA